MLKIHLSGIIFAIFEMTLLPLRHKRSRRKVYCNRNRQYCKMKINILCALCAPLLFTIRLAPMDKESAEVPWVRGSNLVRIVFEGFRDGLG